MNPEETKVGEICYVRVKVDRKDSEGVYCQLIDADGNDRKAFYFYNWMLYSFLPVPPAPKYDPCRLFKKGDKVKPCSWRNRRASARYGATRIIPDTRVLEVASDELHEHVSLIYGDEVIKIHICFLELVTPVEELEPYFLFEDTYSWQVKRENKLCCRYGKSTHPHAKEAAEAERDRLNAEYRKEQAK